MLKGGFLYLHSAEVPKTTMTTLLFALGRWWQQREALDVTDGPEARCAKHGGAKPSLERPTPPLFVAGMVEHTEEKMRGWIGWWQASKQAKKRRRRSLPCDELVVCYVRRSSKSSFLVLFLIPSKRGVWCRRRLRLSRFVFASFPAPATDASHSFQWSIHRALL